VTGYEQGDKNGFLDYFRAKHPEIQLEADYFPDIYTKYEKTAVAGTPPDVSFVSVVSVYDYAKKGFLTNLQPYWNRSKLGMGNYYQVFFDAMRYPSTTADLYSHTVRVDQYLAHLQQGSIPACGRTVSRRDLDVRQGA